MAENPTLNATPDRTATYDPMEMLTIEEVAALLKVSKSWVYSQAQSGRLPAKKMSYRALRFFRKDVQAFVEGLTYGPSEHLATPAERP